VAPPADVPATLSRDDEARIKKATRAVLCYCGCSPTLVDECICGTARQIKDDMKAKLLGGSSPEQLVERYITQYGEQYLAAPPKEGFNLVIWFFPAIAFVGLSLVFWYVLQRLTKRREDHDESKTAEHADGSLDRYAEEIDRAVTERSTTSR
jgi:cytochrome c-type biogenesis protein CcmH/NrfF